MSMREFKVIRMSRDGTKLYEEYLMFRDFDAADTWATERNEREPGSVVDLEEMPVSELKYEY